MKRTSGAHVKLTDDERANLEASARAENLTVSGYLRQRALGARPVAQPGEPAVESPVPALKSYHVDDLGPDSLRSDNGALTR